MPDTPKSRRTVEVDDPRLSQSTNQRLTEELRIAVGADSVNVPVDRPHPSQGDEPLDRGPLLSFTNNRLLIRSMATSGVVIGAILALTTGDWWLLPLVLIVLAGATVSIAQMVIRMTRIPEHASPQTVAAMEEDGVRNPDSVFSDLVSEFSEAEVEEGSEDRTAAVEESLTTANAEHASAITPTGGRSRAVGP